MHLLDALRKDAGSLFLLCVFVCARGHAHARALLFIEAICGCCGRRDGRLIDWVLALLLLLLLCGCGSSAGPAFTCCHHACTRLWCSYYCPAGSATGTSSACTAGFYGTSAGAWQYGSAACAGACTCSAGYVLCWCALASACCIFQCVFAPGCLHMTFISWRRGAADGGG